MNGFPVELTCEELLRHSRVEGGGMVRMRHAHAGQVGRHLRQRVHARHLVLLFPLHAPVLEPDLDLPLGEAECVGDLYPSPARQVTVEVELLLELECLVAGVRRSLSFRLPIGVQLTCGEKVTRSIIHPLCPLITVSMDASPQQ